MKNIESNKNKKSDDSTGHASSRSTTAFLRDDRSEDTKAQGPVVCCNTIKTFHCLAFGDRTQAVL